MSKSTPSTPARAANTSSRCSDQAGHDPSNLLDGGKTGARSKDVLEEGEKKKRGCKQEQDPGEHNQDVLPSRTAVVQTIRIAPLCGLHRDDETDKYGQAKNAQLRWSQP